MHKKFAENIEQGSCRRPLQRQLNFRGEFVLAIKYWTYNTT